MNLIYHSTGVKREREQNYFIINEKEEYIGSVEGYLNDEGHLTTVVRINPEFQKKGLGYTAFRKVFIELNNEIKINRIVGNWMKDEEFGDCDGGMSTNLKLFLKCIETDNASNCAFKTPTGQWALKLGFNKCEIKRKSSVSATVEFYK